MKSMTPLPRLSHKLHELYGDRGPGYDRAYKLVLNGLLPTIIVNDRYYVQDADLPAVAKLLGVNTSGARSAA